MSDIFDEPKQETEKRFPLYPHLSEDGAKEAEAVIEWFKKRMLSVCEEALGKIYVDIPAYIESDAWTNFRNDLMDGFRDYNTRKKQCEYDFAAIRAKIYVDFRDEIIKDLDQDNLKKIESLQKEIAHMREMERYR